MRCPYCKKENVAVVDTRSRDSGTTIWRRRECLSCDKRFSSREKIDFSYLLVIKGNGKKEPLSREKIVSGIRKSFGKDRLPEQIVEKLGDEVLGEIHKLAKPQIKSQEIGEMVLARLKKLDPVAYVRFASVFRDFRDAKTFRKTLEELE